MSRVVGICHICGIHGPLSFEHVPPRSAFNDRPVAAMPFEQALHLGPDDKLPKGEVQQRGMGGTPSATGVTTILEAGMARRSSSGAIRASTF